MSESDKSMWKLEGLRLLRELRGDNILHLPSFVHVFLSLGFLGGLLS